MTATLAPKSRPRPNRPRGGASVLCPQCQHPTRVVETRRLTKIVHRRRVCPQGHETNTRERVHK